MIAHLVRLGFCLVLAIPAAAIAADACGIGCHSTPAGVCVRDGWEQGLPVRNERPATSRPRSPCGSYFRRNSAGRSRAY